MRPNAFTILEIQTGTLPWASKLEAPHIMFGSGGFVGVGYPFNYHRCGAGHKAHEGFGDGSVVTLGKYGDRKGGGVSEI